MVQVWSHQDPSMLKKQYFLGHQGHWYWPSVIVRPGPNLELKWECCRFSVGWTMALITSKSDNTVQVQSAYNEENRCNGLLFGLICLFQIHHKCHESLISETIKSQVHIYRSLWIRPEISDLSLFLAKESNWGPSNSLAACMINKIVACQCHMHLLRVPERSRHKFGG